MDSKIDRKAIAERLRQQAIRLDNESKSAEESCSSLAFARSLKLEEQASVHKQYDESIAQTDKMLMEYKRRASESKAAAMELRRVADEIESAAGDEKAPT
jgi:hypothetical protein